jgi:hypothetical protein
MNIETTAKNHEFFHFYTVNFGMFFIPTTVKHCKKESDFFLKLYVQLRIFSHRLSIFLKLYEHCFSNLNEHFEFRLLQKSHNKISQTY